MLCTVLNKSWKKPSTKQQLYGHLPPISQTIQVKWARHAGHSWRKQDKLKSDFFFSGLLHMNRVVLANWQKLKFISSVQTYRNYKKADRDKWQDRVKGICAVSIPWGWWWWWCCLLTGNIKISFFIWKQRKIIKNGNFVFMKAINISFLIEEEESKDMVYVISKG